MGEIMGKTKRLWEDMIEDEVDDFVDGIIPKEKLSDDAKEMYHFDDADTSYKSLNVRVSVYDQIKRIAKQDNRTINATIALMVKETLKNRRRENV
jgi:hypothetical protein